MATGRGVKRLRDLIAQIELLPRGVAAPPRALAPQSIPFASRVRCLVALGACRRRTALGPGLLAAGPASTEPTPLKRLARAGSEYEHDHDDHDDDGDNRHGECTGVHGVSERWGSTGDPTPFR
jgi:hypothetical protein